MYVAEVCCTKYMMLLKSRPAATKSKLETEIKPLFPGQACPAPHPLHSCSQGFWALVQKIPDSFSSFWDPSAFVTSSSVEANGKYTAPVKWVNERKRYVKLNHSNMIVCNHFYFPLGWTVRKLMCVENK